MVEFGQVRHYRHRHAQRNSTPAAASGRLIAELGGLEGLQREAQRMFVRNLAHRVTQALDRMAGPRSLSAAERDVQQLCRDRFVLYDPTCSSQVTYVYELSKWATASEAVPSGTGGFDSEGLASEGFDSGGSGTLDPGTGNSGTRGSDTGASDEDHLMAALLEQNNSEKHPSRVPDRRNRNGESARRRTRYGRRRGWDAYLGKWR